MTVKEKERIRKNHDRDYIRWIFELDFCMPKYMIFRDINHG